MGWRSGARWHEQKLIMVLRTALVSTVATAALQLVAAPQLEVVQRRARLAAASPAHASPLPLPSQLLMLHEIEASTYVAKPARAVHRRAQESTAATTETLTATNTAPIQLQLDTSQLYENSSEPYTTCHRIGAWFRWNFPRSLGPPCEAAQLPTQAANQDDVRTWAGFARTQRALFDGEGDAQANIPCGEADGRVSAFHPELNPTGEICNRNYSPDAQNCWGVCLVEDVVEGDEMRSFMVAKMNEAIEEISRYFRVRARSAPLRLRQSAGQYLGLYTSVPGLTTASECAKDAKRIWRLPIRPELCTTGFDADAIVFLSLPQYIPRVSGWGATALQDDIGRPVVLAVGWSVPSSGGISTLVGSARQRREQINTRAVLIHEMIHALGFNTLSFIQAGIITQGSATDADGSIDPTVWFAIGPRTLTTASHYFNCTGLERLPLMAENQLGESARGSHWETRILNDEIMAYGEGKMVSEVSEAIHRKVCPQSCALDST